MLPPSPTSEPDLQVVCEALIPDATPEGQLEQPVEFDTGVPRHLLEAGCDARRSSQSLDFKTGVAVSADLWLGGFRHARPITIPSQEWLLGT